MKKILLTILLILITLYLLFTYSDVFKAKLITTYSKNYKESLFNDKLIGISEIELLKKLGKPLKVTQNLSGYESFLYTKDLDKIEIANGYVGITFKDKDYEEQEEIAFSLITFNKYNKCFSQWKTSTYKDTIDLSGKSKEDVIKIYGRPNRKMKCDDGYKVYKYSKLNTNITNNDSTYQINVRLVFIDKSNKVVKIYKNINLDNNEYLGCCGYE